jgi:hypothetical protein
MKHLMMRFSLWLPLLLAGGSLDANAQFEGILESHNLTVDETDTPRNFSMTIWLGKGKMRVETSAIGTTPASTMIYRPDKGVFWVLNADEKTYIEVLQNPEQNNAPGYPSDSDKAQMRKTGKSKTILSYRCDQYVVRRPGEETEIWGTTQLGGLMKALDAVLGSNRQESTGEWVDELTKLGVYPLVARTKVDGKLIESQEVTKIEKRPIQSDLFELPAGFQKESVQEGMH